LLIFLANGKPILKEKLPLLENSIGARLLEIFYAVSSKFRQSDFKLTSNQLAELKNRLSLFFGNKINFSSEDEMVFILIQKENLLEGALQSFTDCPSTMADTRVPFTSVLEILKPYQVSTPLGSQVFQPN